MSAIYTRTGTVKAMKLTPEAMHFRDVTWSKGFFTFSIFFYLLKYRTQLIGVFYHYQAS